MNPLYEAALEVQAVLRDRGWRFCIIGGLAVERWGQPRATQDVDLTLLTGFGDEETYIAGVLAKLKPRRPDAAKFALASRVLLLEAGNGIGVDIALGGFPFEERIVSRATPFQYGPEVSLITCSAEDLVVLKAFAERELDWFDIEGILARQTGKLDWRYIRRQLRPLCEVKDSPDILDELERRRKKIAGMLRRR